MCCGIRDPQQSFDMMVTEYIGRVAGSTRSSRSRTCWYFSVSSRWQSTWRTSSPLATSEYQCGSCVPLFDLRDPPSGPATDPTTAASQRSPFWTFQHMLGFLHQCCFLVPRSSFAEVACMQGHARALTPMGLWGMTILRHRS